MSINNKNINQKKEEWILFCPKCHNVRVRMHSDTYADRECDRCKSEMIWHMSKKDYDKNNTEEKRKIINNLKYKYPEVIPPSEILLGKISDDLRTIKNIFLFYFALTIIAIIIILLSMS